MTPRPPRTLSLREQRVIIWVRRNPNVCSDVARACRVDNSYISLILRGKRKSKDGRIERMLKRRGAPI